MADEILFIRQQLAAFRKKFYLNLLWRGLILLGAALLSYWLVASLLEFSFWLTSGFRFSLILFFVLLLGAGVYFLLLEPIRWWFFHRGLSDEEAAALIGKKFPAIGDRLVNFLQLQQASGSPTLIQAGVQQKFLFLQKFSFPTAIDFRESKSLLKFLYIPLALILVLLVLNKSIFTESIHRIYHFKEEFTPQAPFQFVVDEPSLYAYYNEDFLLRVSLRGDALPDAAYVLFNGQKLAMTADGSFSFLFEKMQRPLDFKIEAAGYFSKTYSLSVLYRPDVQKMSVSLFYPAYTHRKNETLDNAGALSIPEGTRVRWSLAAEHANKAWISFGQLPAEMMKNSGSLFSFDKSFRNPNSYSVFLENDSIKSKEKISFPIEVIKDAYPEIRAHTVADTIHYAGVYVGGTIRDDYANSKLAIIYTINNEAEKSVSIPIVQGLSQQSFIYFWHTDSLRLRSTDKLSYYVKTWDNDAINGAKASVSERFAFQKPTQAEINQAISEAGRKTESMLEKNLNKEKSLQEKIHQAEQKLRSQNETDWQDKKMLEDIVKQKQQVEKQLSDLQKQQQVFQEKAANELKQNERIKAKQEQIQKLLNELLDEETKKLFKQLEEMLKENASAHELRDLLEKLERKELNLEREMERALELFKQLQFDMKMEQSINQLQNQAKQQKELSEQTKGTDKKDKEAQKDLLDKQHELKEQFKEFKNSLEELKELNENLESPNSELPKEEKLNSIEEKQDKSEQSLEKNQPEKSAQNQKEAAEKMEELAKEMEQMQNSMQMEMDEQNMAQMRKIVHDLVQVSFEQENITRDFRKTNISDPKYAAAARAQILLKDSFKSLEDSLLALTKKDPFLSNTVIKNLEELSYHFKRSSQYIKEQNQPSALSEMQFSMKSMNDLSLLLNDHMDMMSQMKKSGGKPGKKKGKKTTPLSQLQQKLNQQIEEIKKGNKSGKQLSEELMRLAAEQERIRESLQEQEKTAGEENGNKSNNLVEEMKKTELDIVNKQITEETIRRQHDIVTRMLESEKSERENEQDDERKGETAKEQLNSRIPPSFLEYFKKKNAEIEQLKVTPPKLQPFYKNEIKKYYERLSQD